LGCLINLIYLLAMAGVFVLFPMLHPQFQPVVPSMTDHVDIWTTAANDGC
jgi:hypothetical protein